MKCSAGYNFYGDVIFDVECHTRNEWYYNGGYNYKLEDCHPSKYYEVDEQNNILHTLREANYVGKKVIF